MNILIAGANLGLTGLKWHMAARFPTNIQHDIGLVALPVNEARQPQAAPCFAQHGANTPNGQQGHCAWFEAQLQADNQSYQLSIDLSTPPDPDVSRILLVLYRFGARGPLAVGQQLTLQLDASFEYPLALENITASAMIVGELYLKAGQWKFRALAETSAYGLAALGRRLGIELDETSPYSPSSPDYAPQEASSWSGTAFMVAPGVFMTNSHVIADAQRIYLNSMQGRLDIEPLLSDSTNDLALLRAQPNATMQAEALPFRRPNASLAETVTVLGYPLTSLMGTVFRSHKERFPAYLGRIMIFACCNSPPPFNPAPAAAPYSMHKALF